MLRRIKVEFRGRHTHCLVSARQCEQPRRIGLRTATWVGCRTPITRARAPQRAPSNSWKPLFAKLWPVKGLRPRQAARISDARSGSVVGPKSFLESLQARAVKPAVPPKSHRKVQRVAVSRSTPSAISSNDSSTSRQRRKAFNVHAFIQSKGEARLDDRKRDIFRRSAGPQPAQDPLKTCLQGSLLPGNAKSWQIWAGAGFDLGNLGQDEGRNASAQWRSGRAPEDASASLIGGALGLGLAIASQ